MTCQLFAICDRGIDLFAAVELGLAVAAWVGVFVALAICVQIWRETR